MSLKLNNLADRCTLVSAPGNFAAIAAYCGEYGTAGAEVATIATMNAAMSQGIREFYSPVFPRGLRLNTAEEVRKADLDVQHIQITPAPDAGTPEIIVSGHAGTRAVLAERFPGAVVIEGNVSPDDIAGKVVAGTLPPHLVATTKAYVYAQVRDFDYSRDADLGGDELRERLVINDPATVAVG